MREIRYLVKRNAALFLSNGQNMLLSLASILIVLSLYVFFLRDFLLAMTAQAGADSRYLHAVTDRIMFAGLLVVVNTTTCFGVMQICVNDVASGIRKDFQCAPVSSFVLHLGYWITGSIVSGIFTIVTALFGEFFFGREYNNILPVSVQINILGIIVFSSCINSGILLCLVKSLKSTATFSTLANLYGTIIGFLAGAYLPYCFYPPWLQKILFWFPPTQITSIIRQQYVRGFEKSIVWGNHPKAIKTLYQNFGIEQFRKGQAVSTYQQWAVLVIALAVLLLYLWICTYERDTRSKEGF